MSCWTVFIDCHITKKACGLPDQKGVVICSEMLVAEVVSGLMFANFKIDFNNQNIILFIVNFITFMPFLIYTYKIFISYLIVLCDKYIMFYIIFWI